MHQNYLDTTRKLFRYYKSLGDQAMAQLKLSELRYQPSEESNNIATIVKHLHGNMLSRWTDFLTADGEKTWRNRDQEFEDTLVCEAAIKEAWEAGWECLFSAIDPLTVKDMDKIIYIRNEGHTILEAMQRQLGHYSYHVGQIVFLARLAKKGAWESLSIPKGGSTAFNKDKFDQERSRKFFTEGDSGKKKI